jgi:hypothetical protein
MRCGALFEQIAYHSPNTLMVGQQLCIQIGALTFHPESLCAKALRAFGIVFFTQRTVPFLLTDHKEEKRVTPKDNRVTPKDDPASSI